MIKVVIVDDNIRLVDFLCIFLAEQSGIEVVATAYDGIAGVDVILQHAPDVVILDNALPGIDGIAVMDRLKAHGSYPAVIMLSATLDIQQVVREAKKAGVKHFLPKPFDNDVLVERIRHEATEKLRSVHGNLLVSLGIPVEIKGHEYFAAALTAAANGQSLSYRQIAEEFDTTPKAVERAMRHAVEVAWKQGDKMREVFDALPSNSDFVQGVLK